jgi:hypothetical protein
MFFLSHVRCGKKTAEPLLQKMHYWRAFQQFADDQSSVFFFVPSRVKGDCPTELPVLRRVWLEWFIITGVLSRERPESAEYMRVAQAAIGLCFCRIISLV